jgi:hypothetical protein
LALEGTSLRADGDPATALFTFFIRMAGQTAAKKTVIEFGPTACH